MNLNPLQQLQEDAVAYLLGNPDTAVVPFQTFRKMATEDAVKEAIGAWEVRSAGKVGIACLVLMPSLFAEYPNLPGPQGAIELIIRTFEDPKVNNTNLSAEDVGMANLRWFGDGLIIEGLTALYPSNKGPALKPNYDYPGMFVYDTVLAGKLPQDATARTVAPTFADDDAGNVTLACVDPDAEIYFTTSGEMPQPGKAEHIYTEPFAVPAGTIVRALAWNTDKLPSDVAQGTINIP